MAIDPEPSDEALTRFLPQARDSLRDLFGRLDPSFGSIWSQHVGRLLGRDQLDERTRFLVLTSQYTVTRRPEQLEENLGAALSAGVDAAELLEIILQAYVYMGPWVVAEACRVYESVLTSRGEVPPDLPKQRRDVSRRDLDEERATWSSADAADGRIDELLETYGWEAISNGLRLRPGHHINMLDTLDALDPDFLKTWLDAVYEGMYGRGIVDDRTRLLCVVGATLALGETHQ